MSASSDDMPTTRKVKKVDQESQEESPEWKVRFARLRQLIEALDSRFLVNIILPSGRKIKRDGYKVLMHTGSSFLISIFRTYKKALANAGVEYASDAFWITVGKLQIGKYTTTSVGTGETLPLVDTMNIADIVGLENIEAFVEKHWLHVTEQYEKKVERQKKVIDRRIRRGEEMPASYSSSKKVWRSSVILNFHLKTNLENMFVLAHNHKGAVREIAIPRFAMSRSDAMKGFRLALERRAKDLPRGGTTIVEKLNDDGTVRYVYSTNGREVRSEVYLWEDTDRQTYVALPGYGRYLEDAILLDEDEVLIGNRVVKKAECVGCAADLEGVVSDEGDLSAGSE